MRRHSHAGVPHVTCGRPPTFDGDAQQEGDDQGSSASSSVVLAYITPYGILYLIITPISTRPAGGRGHPASHSPQPRARLTQMCGGAWSMEDEWTHSRRRARCPCHVYTKKTHVYTVHNDYTRTRTPYKNDSLDTLWLDTVMKKNT